MKYIFKITWKPATPMCWRKHHPTDDRSQPAGVRQDSLKHNEPAKPRQLCTTLWDFRSQPVTIKPQDVNEYILISTGPSWELNPQPWRCKCQALPTETHKSCSVFQGSLELLQCEMFKHSAYRIPYVAGLCVKHHLPVPIAAIMLSLEKLLD